MASEALRKLRDRLRNAFDLASPHGPLTDEDLSLLRRIADKVVARRMAMPAVLFLSSVKPLNSLGSQALVFLRPFVSELFFGPADYDRMTAILDRREGIDALIREIEAAERVNPKSEIRNSKEEKS